ncbi:MAG TPA: DinB family protein [Vicinamibacterales bacterium]|nr:DinB family protein [Vicinamibacterales bacterium]
MGIDYTTLSLAEVRAGLDDVAREAQTTFGRLDARQLNWRPDASQWSVAQCFEHLITANRLIFQAAEEALTGAQPRSIWRRLPFLLGVFGRMLIRSQAPTATKKFSASPKAQPGTSDIAADIVQRFIDQHRDAVARAQTLDEREASRAIMTSPFINVITYNVLDAWRLVLAHDCRHVEQARRVKQALRSE